MQTKAELTLPVQSPLFDHLLDEIHSRSFPKIQGLVALANITVLHHDKDKSAQLQHLHTLADLYRVEGPEQDTNCYYQDLGELDIRWEYHTEFSTYTFLRLNRGEPAFNICPWSLLPEDWSQSIPGHLISATHIDVQPVEPGKNQLHKLFGVTPVAASQVSESNAQIWASFRACNNGFDRLLVVDQGLTQIQIGRLLRSILELSSYRMMTLLAVPASRELLPKIMKMEKELAGITLELSKLNINSDNQKSLLAQLSILSAQLESLIADNQGRFDACNAYLDIVHNRLNELKEHELSGLPTLTDFLRRRLEPAGKTSASLKQRMLNMSNRIEKASDLLRTNINLSLEEQNQDLLKALNRRSHIQLRLHQLVESVSMIAISYYLVQLLGYMLVLPKPWLTLFSKEQVIAVSVPFVVGAVWYVLHRLKRRWRKE